MVNSPLCVTMVAVSGNRAKKQQPLLFIDDNKFCRRRRAMDKLTNKIYRQLVILPLTSNVVDGKKNLNLFFYLPKAWAEFFCFRFPLNPLRFTSHQKNWHTKKLSIFAKLQFFLVRFKFEGINPIPTSYGLNQPI